MKRSVSTLAAVALSACSTGQNEAENKPDQEFGLELAGQTIKSLEAAFGPSNVLVVCGPSAGRGVDLDGRGEAVWESDSIRDGRTAFIWDARSAPDVVFRDAGGAWISATEDGGNVHLISDDTATGAQVWTIIYEDTGVVEAHNIIRSEVGLIDIFTSNKPTVSRMSPSMGSAKVFLSNCVRP